MLKYVSCGNKVSSLMALNSDDDDDWVLLRCTDPHQTDPPESDHTEILISTADISTWDFPTILTHQFFIVKSKRSRLIQHSSYFRGLLCGTFSDSGLNCISIKWNLETFMSILKIIFDFPVDVTSNNFLLLFEGALFFGVELLLLKLKAWLIDVTSLKDLCSLQIQLDDLINIWKFGIEHASDFIPELCTSYLARNFMWATHCNSFLHIPCNLLVSCIKHPDLTVDSEWHLADAFIVWLTANTEQFESSSSTRDDCNGILKEIRISLLPLWFAAGKRRCCYFLKFANQSIEAILDLTAHSSTSMMNVLGDIGSHHLKIRLTQYTKKVDLSGCPQMKFAILLVSMLLCSHSTDPMPSKVIKQFSINLEQLDKNQWQNAWALLPTLSFEVVEEVDISNCPGLYLEAAIECFCKSFPCLRVLKAAHSLNFRMMKLCQLVQKCPLLSEVDLTVDVSPVIPSQVSVVSSSPALTSRGSTVSLEIDAYPSGASQLYMSKSLLSNITKLTLEGRVDVSDYELKNISELCASLCYLNLRGCTSVTDAGISILVLRCIKLHSLVVCDTSFGQNSILALTSGIPNLNRFRTQQTDDNNAKSLAFKLQVLHMGGCNGVDETSLSKLMSETTMLKSLCLRETQIIDSTLYSFLGSFLEMLDVSDTKVISDCVLINIMESLRHLQVLALCHCLGDISPVSFKYSVPNLRKLKLERVTPWMTNDDLVILTQNCANLIELSLLGCRLLNSDSQQIISSGWPGLISIHLEDCGEVTRNGVASLFDCKAVEDIMLRHNGTGIQKNFILDAASMMPMLRKVSLDVCDASEGDFEIPNFADRYFLSIVKIARCKLQRCGLDLQKFCRTPVHKETLVLVWDSKNLTRTVIKERV
ncbi:BTB/POZ domain-containing protein FBL11 isoform X3 [Camellia sinensis]|uniref:BTB/POZ domain-containing protein FBL11 isoform X3 n=1 Tax=Camellia sinensis TaxID=4442 RepID=UPI001035D6E2|nr:BTB/POZ domain-containing protein FBL11 isoform X3 [Camellia sinensis]